MLSARVNLRPQQAVVQRSTSRTPVVIVRAAETRNGPAADDGKPFIHLLPNNGQWPKGIPPVMGAHLMASNVVAPVSVSKGAGIDLTPHQFQYHSKATNSGAIVYASSTEAAQGLATAVAEASKAAIAAKGTFTLVLSGGSLINSLETLVSQQGIEWDKVHVFFVDERNVPHSSADSTYKAAKEALLSKVAIPASQVHAIQENLPVREAAVSYEGRIIAQPASVLPRSSLGIPSFDLVLLGVGPDGHVASLFPNRPQTSATSSWVLPVSDSPKPPAERITFSMPLINAAKEVLIVALGENKAEIVQRALEVQALPGALPAQLVRPEEGKVTWVLDAASAKNLSSAGWANNKAYPRNQ